MWMTRGWKVAVLCGALAAPFAVAKPTAVEAEPPTDTDVREPALEAPEGFVQLFDGAPDDDLALPRLRHVEPVACQVAPQDRLWVASTEQCGETECVQHVTVWVGSWTVEDAEVDVQCDAEHVVLSTHDWRLVLVPDGKGDYDVEETTLDVEAAMAPVAGG
ncbi:hypothetical protein LZ198_06350 [Myxococcus sp. K15C18031901]|uniref:hypothetical protein n=1 Tax=Myxococcus dinghuensis TaxID=2906761 RepID=UPI0020A7D138|nr:hypothetical protein [Myxococcus dinghuensis]MCP3098497.1 hypothetical protein [Myxococcus dinghuensis]